MKKGKTVKEFERDLCTLLGLEGRNITKLTVTIEFDQLPVITVEELGITMPETVVAKSYTLQELPQ